MDEKYNLDRIYHLKEIGDKDEDAWKFMTIPGPLIYRIYNIITNKSYIGFTKIHLHSRFFTGWRGGHFGYYDNPNLNQHLYKSMRKYGLENFTLEILKLNPDEGDEEKFIKEYDSYNNGYNLSINGLGYTYEGEYMQFFNKITHEQVKVRDFEADRYINDPDWERGNINMKGQIWINDGINCIRIHPEEYENYDKEKWKTGNLYMNNNSYTLGKFWINNGKVNKVVSEEEFRRLEEDGWVKGTINDKITINKEGKIKKIHLYDLEEYLKLGWIRGTGFSSIKGRIIVNNGEINKVIDTSELDKYLSSGWVKGRFGEIKPTTKGKIRITNGFINKCIFPDELEDYLSDRWRKGVTYKGRNLQI